MQPINIPGRLPNPAYWRFPFRSARSKKLIVKAVGTKAAQKWKTTPAAPWKLFWCWLKKVLNT